MFESSLTVSVIDGFVEYKYVFVLCVYLPTWNTRIYLYFMDKNMSVYKLGPLLQTQFNFNPSMDKQPQNHWNVVWITYPSPNFNGCAVEISESISKFTPYL